MLAIAIAEMIATEPGNKSTDIRRNDISVIDADLSHVHQAKGPTAGHLDVFLFQMNEAAALTKITGPWHMTIPRYLVYDHY